MVHIPVIATTFLVLVVVVVPLPVDIRMVLIDQSRFLSTVLPSVLLPVLFVSVVKLVSKILRLNPPVGRCCELAWLCRFEVLCAISRFLLPTSGFWQEQVVLLAREQRRSFLAAPCQSFKRIQMANLDPVDNCHRRRYNQMLFLSLSFCFLSFWQLVLAVVE